MEKHSKLEVQEYLKAKGAFVTDQPFQGNTGAPLMQYMTQMQSAKSVGKALPLGDGTDKDETEDATSDQEDLQKAEHLTAVSTTSKSKQKAQEKVKDMIAILEKRLAKTNDPNGKDLISNKLKLLKAVSKNQDKESNLEKVKSLLVSSYQVLLSVKKMDN